jgi:hypothetical protein
MVGTIRFLEPRLSGETSPTPKPKKTFGTVIERPLSVRYEEVRMCRIVRNAEVASLRASRRRKGASR